MHNKAIPLQQLLQLQHQLQEQQQQQLQQQQQQQEILIRLRAIITMATIIKAGIVGTNLVVIMEVIITDVVRVNQAADFHILIIIIVVLARKIIVFF